MLRDAASCEADHQRFIQRAIAGELVWGLEGSDGFAHCESNEHDDANVLMFWSDRAYAARVQKLQFPECKPAEISLFNFLFRWLPGMARDKVLAGTNWTGNLFGTETDPEELQAQIIERMPTDMRSRYHEELRRGIAEQGAEGDAVNGAP